MMEMDTIMKKKYKEEQTQKMETTIQEKQINKHQ
jgi:hypothetical protein